MTRKERKLKAKNKAQNQQKIYSKNKHPNFGESETLTK